MDPRISIELIQRYNADPRNFTDAEIETIVDDWCSARGISWHKT